MATIESGAFVALVSVLTLALSRCRCILRSLDGNVRWGIGFTDRALFEDTSHAVPTAPPLPTNSPPIAHLSHTLAGF